MIGILLLSWNKLSQIGQAPDWRSNGDHHNHYRTFHDYCYFIINSLSKGTLKQYLLVPLVLVWIHALGTYMQEFEIGPKWMQYHLSSFGDSTRLMPIVMGILIFKADLSISQWHVPPLPAVWITNNMLKWALPANITSTIAGVVMEIAQVTVLREIYIAIREIYIARGYSGSLDYGDILALLLGGIVVMISHFAFQGSVNRKKTRLLY